MTAIEHANRVLNWQEHLDSKEMPPEWMWPLNDEISDWLEEVGRAKREKYGVADDDDNDKDSGTMMSNEFAKGRGR